jgi:ADP-L-glycero-D-manno-heptose 6-epimerase
MASVAFHFNQQILKTGTIKLFEGSGGYANGEQRRDFIYVSDVVAANLWFLNNHKKSGIFNVGTGQSATFNDVARAVIEWHKKGTIEYTPFPENLAQHYQSYTQADISRLREIGFSHEFKNVAQGVKTYLDKLAQSGTLL